MPSSASKNVSMGIANLELREGIRSLKTRDKTIKNLFEEGTYIEIKKKSHQEQEC